MNSVPGCEESIYQGYAASRTGGTVPLFRGGKPANSLYNPEKEAEKAAARFPAGTFAVFGGLADGRRIEYFLQQDRENTCIVIEKNHASLVSLSAFPSVKRICSCARVTVLSLDTTGNGGLTGCITAGYLPALFRNFSLDILQSWRNACPEAARQIEEETRRALDVISGDFSTQAAFGRIWLANALQNICLFRNAENRFPFPDRKKTAVITAAGPSLDKESAALRENRESLVVFAADTSLPVLVQAGVYPDFVVSIDPQPVSARHLSVAGKNICGTRKPPVFLADICASPFAVRTASAFGWPVILTGGGHPLAAYLQRFARLPPLETAAGTVTASAADAARRMGFSAVRFAGADFACTGGKPYCRGTYLDVQFGSGSIRTRTAETRFNELMFRTKTKKIPEAGNRFTYRTELLDSYRDAVARLAESSGPTGLWTGEDFRPFPCESFLQEFRCSLLKMQKNAADIFRAEDPYAAAALLPAAAFFRRKNPQENRENILKKTIQLALHLIDRYTSFI